MACSTRGLVLPLYQNSVSTAYFLLFGLSFWLHALGGVKQYNIEQALKEKPRGNTVAVFRHERVLVPTAAKLAK
jgi:hypothetical protein